jgi:hypothetical protein
MPDDLSGLDAEVREAIKACGLAPKTQAQLMKEADAIMDQMLTRLISPFAPLVAVKSSGFGPSCEICAAKSHTSVSVGTRNAHDRMVYTYIDVCKDCVELVNPHPGRVVIVAPRYVPVRRRWWARVVGWFARL